tara:strand:+ start:60 stop:275 length:216 start_codon:yes stop_codon:yes gene_type:complete
MSRFSTFFSIYKSVIFKIALVLIPVCVIFSYVHGFWRGIFFGFWVMVIVVLSFYWSFHKAMKANGKNPFNN